MGLAEELGVLWSAANLGISYTGFGRCEFCFLLAQAVPEPLAPLCEGGRF